MKKLKIKNSAFTKMNEIYLKKKILISFRTNKKEIFLSSD